ARRRRLCGPFRLSPFMVPSGGKECTGIRATSRRAPRGARLPPTPPHAPLRACADGRGVTRPPADSDRYWRTAAPMTIGIHQADGGLEAGVPSRGDRARPTAERREP